MENTTTTTTTTKRGRPSGSKKSTSSAACAEGTKNIDYDKVISEQANTIEQLKKMVEELTNIQKNNINNNPPVISYSSMMDRPCTVIHLRECVPGLPTTIVVRGIPYQFTNFGEKRIFRFEDIQLIVSKYRDFFERGVITLGSDCDEFKDSFGVNLMNIPMSVSKYKKLAEMSDEEFQNIFHSLNSCQKILVAKTWVKRFMEKMPGYNNISRITFINNETNGFLNKFIENDMRTI